MCCALNMGLPTPDSGRCGQRLDNRKEGIQVNDIQIFDNTQFGSVRITTDENGKTLFCAKDVAAALGYKDTINAIKQHCKGVAIYHPLQTNGGVQPARFITEGDVYRLIGQSTLPAAVAFESWLFDEVVPTIAHTGGYQLPMTREQEIAHALISANEVIEEQSNLIAAKDVQIKQLQPKAAIAESMIAGADCIDVQSMAQLLQQTPGTLWHKGRTTLYDRLVSDGFLIRKPRSHRVDGNREKHSNGGRSEYIPSQKSYGFKEPLFFRDERSYFDNETGERIPYTVPLITPYGREYFINRYAIPHMVGSSNEAAI